MSTKIIQLNDSYRKSLKDRISMKVQKPRGEVSIYEKDKQGGLTTLVDKSNMIVFNGREWLLRRAFGSALDYSEAELYNKVIQWFGVGNGGGEPGNPLQAGATYGQDDGLYSPVRLREGLIDGTDPGYLLYGSNYDSEHGWYKKFSNVTLREDRGNPYTIGTGESAITYYPSLIAEIRIELSSDDANGGSYEDLNEACLFIADPSVDDPGGEEVIGGSTIGTSNVLKVSKDSNYAIYYLDTYDIATDIETSGRSISVGDTMWVTGGSDPNDIAELNPLKIIDIFNGEAGVRKGYVVIEKAESVEVDYDPTYPVATFISKEITPYICFSRITFSALRKTNDRELIFLWRIYF